MPTISPSVRRKSMAAGVGVGLLALWVFGIQGIGRASGYWEGAGVDMQYLFSAGRDWLQGVTPHDPEGFVARASERHGRELLTFAYPPHAAPLCVALALLSWPQAMVLMSALNVLGMLVLAWTTHQLTKDGETDSLPAWLLFFLAAAIVGNPFASHVLWMGQTSILAGCAIALAVLFRQRGQWLLAGIALAVAAMKPQLALAPLLYFVFARQWKILQVAGAAVIVFAMLPMLVSGPFGTYREWLAAMDAYRADWAMALGFRHVFGISSTLHEAGLGWGLPPWTPALVAPLLALRPAGFRPIDTIALLLGSTWLLGYSHDYDLACVGLLLASAATSTENRRVQLLVVGLALVLFFPQRIFQQADLSLAARSRELALLGMTGIVVCLRSSNRC